MTKGAGKYDEECTMLRTLTGATTCMVIIINGDRGHGFALQTEDRWAIELIADQLEEAAAMLRKDADAL